MRTKYLLFLSSMDQELDRRGDKVDNSAPRQSQGVPKVQLHDGPRALRSDILVDQAQRTSEGNVSSTVSDFGIQIQSAHCVAEENLHLLFLRDIYLYICGVSKGKGIYICIYIYICILLLFPYFFPSYFRPALLFGGQTLINFFKIKWCCRRRCLSTPDIPPDLL